MPISEAIKALQAAVDEVEWARNSGTGTPDLSYVDSLTEAANTLLREINMEQTELDQKLKAAEQRGRNRAVNAIKAMPAYLGDEGWEELADKAAEAGYDRRVVLRRRRPDDNFTALTIEAAYQHGYRTAAEVALRATRPSSSEGGADRG